MIVTNNSDNLNKKEMNSNLNLDNVKGLQTLSDNMAEDITGGASTIALRRDNALSPFNSEPKTFEDNETVRFRLRPKAAFLDLTNSGQEKATYEFTFRRPSGLDIRTIDSSDDTPGQLLYDISDLTNGEDAATSVRISRIR